MRGRRRRRGAGSCRRSLTSTLPGIRENKDMGDVSGKGGVPSDSQTLRSKMAARRRGGRGRALHGWKEESKLPSQQNSQSVWRNVQNMRNVQVVNVNNVQDMRNVQDEKNVQDLETQDELHSRPRNIRFSQAENMILVTRLLPVYEQLLGKQKSTISFYRKSQMWQEICNAVNGVGHRHRSVHHCKKRFNDLKRQVRNKLNREKSKVGDESPSIHVYYSKYEEELKKVLPAEVIDGFEFFDSDQPQDLYLEEEAGPSCFSQPQHQDRKKNALSLIETDLPCSLDSEPEESPVKYKNHLQEPCPILIELTQSNKVGSSPLRPRNMSAESLILQTKVSTKPKARGLHNKRSLYSTRKKCNAILCRAQTPTKYLNSLKANQHFFRKSIIHQLNVLHFDFGHFTHHINTNYYISKKMLQAETQRNQILFQMNKNIDRLADGIQQLANQQQTERLLIHELLQE
ncbi:uncharacterized protein ACMZJ9_001042 [Mantella aurantiaca]